MNWVTQDVRSWPQFTGWTKWGERAKLGLSGCGVYTLARFENKPAAEVLPLAEAVLYVGMTADQSFSSRFDQFQRSACTGKAGHAGGKSFYDAFGLAAIPPWLWLALCPIREREPNQGAYIRYLERALLWMYVTRYSVLPRCNRQ